ncbi:MAG: lysR [Myxococcaceae bacterium]|nr:lysR [Myxococcaceae bacterium]
MQIGSTIPWDDLRILLALHRQRSFLAAGKALGVSTSTAARRIDALESSLGRPLVQRTRSGTFVEPDALELVALAEQLELGLDALRRDCSDEAISGTVRLSMGEGFVRPITAFLCDLSRKHPRLHFELVAEARFADLSRREADIGIRKARSSSPVLVERLVGRLQLGLYAARSYVDRRLREARLERADFARHDFIGYHGPLQKTPQAEWLVAQGAQRFVFRSNSDYALEEATSQGQGICLLARAQARSLPALIELDHDLAAPSIPVYLVFHKELRNVPRHRLVIKALEAGLRQGLA